MAILTLGLQNLRRQVDAAFPERDRQSDGWIGNAAHQATTSGHNPDDTAGSKPAWNGDPDTLAEVRAWDQDSDLRASPATAQQVVDHIRALRGLDTVLRYLIYNRKIYHSRVGFVPAPYSGPSAHTEHIHYEGAWSQSADNNTTFNYRLEEIPVALTAADKAWQEAMTTRVTTSVIDARMDAAIKEIAEYKVNVKPGRVYPPGSPNAGKPWPDMQPWSRVDAFGSPERAHIADGVRAIDAKLTAILNKPAG